MFSAFKQATFFALLLTAPAGRAQESQNRVLQAIDVSRMTALTGSVHPFAKVESDQGRLEPNTKLEGISVVFKLSAAQHTALQALLVAQQDPSLPQYHKWLTPEQYAGRFGLSSADLAAVRAWLQSAGFVISNTSRSRTQISFTGTVGQIEAAFRTEMHFYRVNGQKHFANSTDLSVPEALSGVVLGIQNLNDFRPTPKNLRQASPEFTSSLSGSHFLAPDDFATIYDLQSLYNAGLDGTGEAIAVVGQTAVTTSDIEKFRSVSGLSVNDPQLILVPGSGTSTIVASDVPEADLDLEWSGAVARNSKIVFVYTGNNTNYNVWNALQYAIDNNLAPVISISYGYCESGLGLSFVQSVQQWAQQANAQGQTISAASGDDGAADCESSGATSASHGLAVDVPASIPEVTGLGGAEFNADVSNPGQYWNSSNNADNGSAITYIPEEAWNDTTQDGNLAAGGGGASIDFSKPSWQTGAGVPNDGKRDVPDISLNASADHDGYLACSQASCVTGYRGSDGKTLTVFGGTSAGAPTFAGILAIINQATKSYGLGNVNPMLYTLAASSPKAFHDVTSGNNIVPCVTGTPNCPSVVPFQFGFTAGTGYDQASGLGSVDGFILATAWPGYNLTKTTTSTTLTSSSSTAISGANVSLTATVKSSSSGGPFTAGTVQFISDGVQLGSPVAVSNGLAVYTTSKLADGTHTISSAYSGDANYSASNSSSITQNITDFSIAANPVSLSLTPGQSGTSTLAVQALDGFAGTVKFSCASSSATAQITCSVAPASLTLSTSNTSGTATLTVSTATTQAGKRHGSFPTWFGATSGGTLAAVVFLGVPRRRRSRILGASLVVFLVAGLGCGGGGAASQSKVQVGTPAGNYTITITGSSGGVARKSALAITVQ